MKKFLLSLCAVVLAVGFTAFTLPSKNSQDVTVVFMGDETNRMQVEEPTNWQVVSVPNCEDGSEFACVFDISEDFIDDSSTPHRLSSSLEINSVPTTTGFIIALNSVKQGEATVLISNIENKD